MRILVLALSVATLASGCGGGDSGVDLASGNPENGKTLFGAQGCVNCHTFSAAGSTRNVGPNLDEAARLYTAEFILESITNPSAYVEKGSGGSIGGSKEYRVPMPASGPDAPNAENVMTEEELADLVAFIESAGNR